MGSGPSLTRRQREVLTLLREGMRNATISDRLGISVGTVKEHLSAIYQELGVTNRTQAVIVAFSLDLPDAPAPRVAPPRRPATD